MGKYLIIVMLFGWPLTACVTINIYFPAAATEKAADKIIDEVWQLQKSELPATDAENPAANSIQKETK